MCVFFFFVYLFIYLFVLRQEDCKFETSLEYIARPCLKKRKTMAQCWWLTTVILVTQEAEIRRIPVQSHPRQIVHETLSQKNPSQKRAGGVAQAVREPA
jgi:hypothetical protein